MENTRKNTGIIYLTPKLEAELDIALREYFEDEIEMVCGIPKKVLVKDK